MKKTNIKISTFGTQLQNSRLLSSKIKIEILKYVTIPFPKYDKGVVYGLEIPREMYGISRKIEGCSLGADKNGFFVYTHRCRSKSFSSPLKIDKKSIDFVESTG